MTGQRGHVSGHLAAQRTQVFELRKQAATRGRGMPTRFLAAA